MSGVYASVSAYYPSAVHKFLGRSGMEPLQIPYAGAPLPDISWWRCDSCGCAVPFKSDAGKTQLKCTECAAPIPKRYDHLTHPLG